jgi:hypothetical protein
LSLTEQIEKLREYPAAAPEFFRQQLERVREQMDKQAPPAQGIDRSGAFVPLPQPTILRRV